MGRGKFCEKTGSPVFVDSVFFPESTKSGDSVFFTVFPYHVWDYLFSQSLKGLVTPRDYGFFLSKNHFIEENFKLFFWQYFF